MPANDRHKKPTHKGVEAPSPKQYVVTYDDANELPEATRAIIISGAGDLHYEDLEGNEITFTFPEGQFALRVRKIYSTGTTVTSVLALV